MNVFKPLAPTDFGALNLASSAWTVSDPSVILNGVVFDGSSNAVTLLALAGTVVWTRPLSDFIAFKSGDSARLDGRFHAPNTGWSGSDNIQIGLEDSGAGVWKSGGPRVGAAIGVESNSVAFASNAAVGCRAALVGVGWALGARLGPLFALGHDTAWTYVGQRQDQTVVAATAVDTVRVSLTRTIATANTLDFSVGARLVRDGNVLIARA